MKGIPRATILIKENIYQILTALIPIDWIYGVHARPHTSSINQ